jgi:presenilin 1
MLGFYDLCAVLTPCGPLKALVRLLQKDEENNEGRGMIPGLLYEAKLPVKRGNKRDDSIDEEEQEEEEPNGRR